MTESFSITLVLMVVLMGTGVLAQNRQVDQGYGATTTNKVWLVKICDQNGANCGTVAIPVTVTGTMSVTGTVTSNAGTGTVNVTCISGCGGAPSFLDTGGFTYGTTPVGIFGAVVDTAATHTIGDGLAGAPRMNVNRILLVSPQGTTTITGTVSATSGTIGQITMPALSVTSGTIGSITMPSLTFTSGTVGQMPALSVTSGTIGLITMPSLTVTSGTIGSLPAITGTVQANAGTGTLNVTFTNTAIQANAGTGTQNVTFTNTGIQVTNTEGINLTQVLSTALSTANPVISGARGSTTVPSAVADAAVVAQRYNKYGDTIIAFAPPELEITGTAQPTATTATAVIAATGTSTTRWKIMFIKVCNFSGTVATEMDITDSSGTIDKFVWTATALNGEPQCFRDSFPDGWPTAANSSISAKLTVSDASGVFVAIKANKTGT